MARSAPPASRTVSRVQNHERRVSDAVDSANRRALGVPEAQQAAVERDTCRASAE